MTNIFLALLTGGLVYVGWRQHQSIRTIERAYVKMSHCPQRLIITQNQAQYSIRMEVKNWGNTPTHVTHTLITHRLYPVSKEELPDPPQYGSCVRQVEAFLVKNDSFAFDYPFSLIEKEIANLIGPNPTEVLYLLGYVDYRDKFDCCHRAGYARRYDPTTNDLVFVTQPNYNYDKPRKKRKDKK